MIQGSIPISPGQNALTVHTGPLEGGIYIVSGNNLGTGTHTIRLTNPANPIGASNNIIAVHRFTTTTVTGTTNIAPREINVPNGWALGCTSDAVTPDVTGKLQYTKVS
jgi:hypothetical protein